MDHTFDTENRLVVHIDTLKKEFFYWEEVLPNYVSSISVVIKHSAFQLGLYLEMQN